MRIAAIDQLVDQFVAQPLDVHRPTPGKVQQRRLRWAAQNRPPAGAAVVDATLFSRSTALPHTGHWRGMRKLGT